ALHCTLRSSWFDLDLDGEPTDAGYRYRYKSVRKAAWFSHADIMSDAFGKAVEQGRACAEQLRMAVKLPPA
nr:cysteine protease [Achromobacter sp.]